MNSFTPWAWRDPALLNGGYTELDPATGPADDRAMTRPGQGGQLDIAGYHVEATDGGIGSIDEASYDVGSAYLVVDTGPWIFGRKVLLPAGTVHRIDHEGRTVHIDRTKQQIKDSPEYDPDTFEKPDYRDRVGTYYEDNYRNYPTL